MPVVGGGRNEAQAFRAWRTTVNGQRIAIIGATQVIDEELISWWEARGAQTGVASARYDMEDRLARQVRRACHERHGGRLLALGVGFEGLSDGLASLAC